jgi:hypothetical protein
MTIKGLRFGKDDEGDSSKMMLRVARRGRGVLD